MVIDGCDQPPLAKATAMITRSLTPTPFGLRLTYSIDSENAWTEYINHSAPAKFHNGYVTKPRAWADTLLGRLRGLCSIAD